MGQTLTNGIYLPDEGEVRCYDGLASNWTTLDSVVGGYNAHVANENIHITSAERNKWDNGVTQAYVLRYANTSLTALGTVAFSALDNTDNIKIGDKVLDSEGKLFALTAVDTANSTATLSALLIDLSKDSDLSNYYTKGETDTLLTAKADDSGVVHKEEAETIPGAKTFSDNLTVYNSDTSGATPSVNIRSAIIEKGDTSNADNLRIQFLDKYNNYVGVINANKNAAGTQYLSLSIRTTDTSNNNIVSTINYYLSKNGDRYFTPYEDNLINLGTSNRKWKDILTYKLNSIIPGALSMPNLNSRADISGYITNLSGSYNSYTPLVDGWIAIHSEDATFIRIADSGSGGSGNTTTSPTARILTCMMPVRANRQCNIYIVCSTLKSAYFIPCQGNI